MEAQVEKTVQNDIGLILEKNGITLEHYCSEMTNRIENKKAEGLFVPREIILRYYLNKHVKKCGFR